MIASVQLAKQQLQKEKKKRTKTTSKAKFRFCPVVGCAHIVKGGQLDEEVRVCYLIFAL